MLFTNEMAQPSMKLQWIDVNWWLVGGFIPSEKYESQLVFYSSQYMEKMKFMFQTTNQH